ncbi:MAG: Calx-beta domain-containing protein [Planctomycetota bacterium]
MPLTDCLAGGRDGSTNSIRCARSVYPHCGKPTISRSILQEILPMADNHHFFRLAFLFAVGFLSALFLSGCGGGSSGGKRSPQTPIVSIENASISEGDSGTTNLSFTINLSLATTRVVTVNCSTADGTAIASDDYLPLSETFVFSANQTTRQISIVIISDTVVEPNEMFNVVLSDAVNATISGTKSTAVGTILNDDNATGMTDFITVGLGGGGAQYTPASSPHNPDLMFVSCDMGGFYRSLDGGNSWRMYDFHVLTGSTSCCPAFDPVDPNRIYFKDKMTSDAGDTWEPILASTPWSGDVQRILVGPTGRVILLSADDEIYISRDRALSFELVSGVSGEACGFYIDPTSPSLNQRIFIATDSSIYRSDDDGTNWAQKTGGLPWTVIISLDGAANSAGTALTLYCVIESRNISETYSGGVYRSTDAGETWTSAMGAGINKTLGYQDAYGASDIPQYRKLFVAESHPDIVNVIGYGTGYWPAYHNTIYRSINGGSTWSAVYFYDYRFAEHNVSHGWLPLSLNYGWGDLMVNDSGFDGNNADPDIMLLSNYGETHLTINGGLSWTAVYSTYADGQDAPSLTPGVSPGYWISRGLEVTTTWNYYVDPHQHQRHFIAYTDIGLARSQDGGISWTYSAKGSTWKGNTYELAFDPETPGKIWAAMSNVHDIPHWTYIHDAVAGPGGVCLSVNGGETWADSNTGLPSAPCCSVIVDPTSASGNRTLYAAMFNYGIYKSTNDGATWSAVNTGIDLATNNHAFLVSRHTDGTLFCCVTAKRTGSTFPVKGALYRSTNAGASWTNITASHPLGWPNGFAVDPTDSDIIYIAAASYPGGSEGGCYKTVNGGSLWTRLNDDADFAADGGESYVHAMFVTIDPTDTSRVYLGTANHGLWISDDAGASWSPFDKIPFIACQRVSFDPDDAEIIYVTTFGGGVWKGPKPD